MVEMAPAVAFVPLPVSSNLLLVEEIPDIPAQSFCVDCAVFSFRQQTAYLFLPCRVSKQDGFKFFQRLITVIPRELRVDNILVFVFVFIFYIGMGQLYGQLTGQLWRNLLRCLLG